MNWDGMRRSPMCLDDAGFAKRIPRAVHGVCQGGHKQGLDPFVQPHIDLFGHRFVKEGIELHRSIQYDVVGRGCRFVYRSSIR